MQSVEASDLARRAAADTQFGLALYQQVRREPGNLFLSPQSISAALTMTWAGARGDTASQMAQVLGLSDDPAAVHRESLSLRQRWQAIQDKGTLELVVANSLWLQKGAPFLDAYLGLTREFYNATPTPVDFIGDAPGACRIINEWVEEQTRNRIRDLLSPSAVDALTRLVLVNAIYFKGRWESPFIPTATQPASFHAATGAIAEVPFMNARQTFGYAEEDALQVLEMPYTGGELSMLILLPRARDGLAALEDRFSAEKLAGWTGALRRREVQASLPKFTFTSSFRLDDTLRALGMHDPFDRQRADFSAMNGRKDDLFISAVVHKAFVDVSEEGTEAAAATGVIVATRAAMPQPVTVFRADHPFLFLIRDRGTGAILFLGRVANPRG